MCRMRMLLPNSTVAPSRSRPRAWVWWRFRSSGRGVEGGEDLLAGLVEAPALLGEAQAPAPPVQEGDAGRILQLGHGVADGALGAVQAPGAAEKLPGLGERVEGPQLGEVEQGGP